jgi:hypothetical protein
MANLTIAAADVRVVRRADEHQHTAPAGEAITAGQYIRFSTTGKFELGNATAAGEVGDGFIAEKSVAIGETVTGLKNPCVLDVGDALSGIAYGVSVFLSDTDGTLADAAGTVSTVVGKVVPGWAGSAKKLLRLSL